MAKVPVEIVVVGRSATTDISAAIELANSEQNEFQFCEAPATFAERLRMSTFEHNKDSDYLDYMEQTRNQIRGYFPFLIAAIDASLAGARFSNLFGSHRAAKGLAVITTSQVPGIILPANRMAAYFVYYFARYALNFIAPGHKNHDDSRGCVFDRKIAKTDIVESMREGALCDSCRRNLGNEDGMLSPTQFSALERLFAMAGRIVNDGLEVDGRIRVFIGSSTEGIAVANKLQELLASDFSIVVWNQGTVFGLGTSTLEALEVAVLEYHHAVFVFTPDDQLHVRGEVKPVARDNVLFELGMFIGKLGRKRAFAVHPGKQNVALPSDLNGITTGAYDPNERNLAAALGPVANRIRNAIVASA